MKQIIIFDLDGTLYSKDNAFFKFLEIKTQKYMMRMTPNLTNKQFKKMEEKIPNLLQALEYLKLDKNKFYEDVYGDIEYETFFKEDKKLKNILSGMNTTNFIVTMSGNKEINAISKLLGIEKYIEKGYSPELLDISSKGEIYEKILVEYDINPKDCFVIGDDFKIDIEPAIAIGMNTVYISNKKDKNADFTAKNIYEALNMIK